MRSKKSSYTDLLRDWQELLDTFGAHLPELDLERAPLSEAFRKMQELRKIQRGLSLAHRRVAERLGEVREEGWESARRLRGLLTWKFGRKKAPGALRSRVDMSPEGSERRRTMRETTRSGKWGEWQRLMAALEMNQADLPHLATQRTQFGTLVGQAEDLFQSQAALSASKQETSQQVAALVTECQRLETVLRFSLKQFYGPTAEKLVEFGIQPFRGRTRKPTPPPPPTELTEPSETVSAVE